MKVDTNLVKQLATTADVINSLNGGTVFPLLKKTKETDHYRLEVEVPGIHPDDLKVEVNGEDLFIYHRIQLSIHAYPNMLVMFHLPYNIARESIYASYEDRSLFVVLPFDDSETNFRKEVKIQK